MGGCGGGRGEEVSMIGASFAGLDYWSNQHVACPHHDKQQSEEGKTKTKKKAMKTGNTLSLPVLFYKESIICLVSLSLSAPCKLQKCCYKQKERFVVGLALVGKNIIVFRFIIEYSKLKGFWPLDNNRSIFI